MRFLFLQSSQKRPHGQRNRQSEADIGKQDAGEQKQPDARCESQTSIKPRSSSKRPPSDSRSEPAQRNRKQSHWYPCSPIVHAENHVRHGHGPVLQRGFF